jgi:hypothetical protein
MRSKSDDGTSYLSNEFVGTHNFFHLVAMVCLVIWGHEILAISDNWYSLLYFSTLSTALGVIYQKLPSIGLQKTHLFAYLAFMAAHILLFYADIGSTDLRFILSSIIAGIYALPFAYDYFNEGKIKNQTLFYIFL